MKTKNTHFELIALFNNAIDNNDFDFVFNNKKSLLIIDDEKLNDAIIELTFYDDDDNVNSIHDEQTQNDIELYIIEQIKKLYNVER